MVGPIEVELAVENMRHTSVSPPFAQALRLEQTATRVFQIQPRHVPGVLQVGAYATAVLTAVTGKPAGDADVIERVALRTTRREANLERLGSDNPPSLSVVIDEAAFSDPSIGSVAANAQIDDLIRIIARYPSVEVAVVSLADAGYAEDRACEVFEVGGAIEATFFETLTEDQISTDADAGRTYRDFVTSVLTSNKADEETLAKLKR
jgi:hypothetical protein